MARLKSRPFKTMTFSAAWEAVPLSEQVRFEIVRCRFAQKMGCLPIYFFVASSVLIEVAFRCCI
jgi:hypothetical protein